MPSLPADASTMLRPPTKITARAVTEPRRQAIGILLEWADYPADWVKGVEIERSANPEGPWEQLCQKLSWSWPEYFDEVAPSAGPYFYRIRAVSGNSISPYSSVVEVLPQPFDWCERTLTNYASYDIGHRENTTLAQGREDSGNEEWYVVDVVTDYAERSLLYEFRCVRDQWVKVYDASLKRNVNRKVRSFYWDSDNKCTGSVQLKTTQLRVRVAATDPISAPCTIRYYTRSIEKYNKEERLDDLRRQMEELAQEIAALEAELQS